MGWGVHDYPVPREAARPEPHCPFCHRECDTIYKSESGYIVGCENCIKTKDAADVPECEGEG